MSPAPIQRGRRGSRRAAGQAIVEFALITPVFFLVFFSIVEFALMTASIGSYNFAVREAARIGSIEGPTDSGADGDIVSAVQSHTQGLVMAKPQEVDIYDADPATGQCLNVTSGGADVAAGDASCREDVYTIAAGGTATQTVNNWPYSARNASEGEADYLGVRVGYQYTYLTGFVAGLGSGLSLSTFSVQRIEPVTNFAPHGTFPVTSRGAWARWLGPGAWCAPACTAVARLEPAWGSGVREGGSI
jgi:Flp pilus assembly protein TadG